MPGGSGSPVSCGMSIAGTGFLTSYGYTFTDGTTTVTQGGQTRMFQKDELGRPIMIEEPESGTTTYSYSYNSTGLQVVRERPEANQTNPSILTTTTTQYDNIGRILTITYNDGLTPNKTFNYDTNCCWTQSATNMKGHLVEMEAQLGTSSSTLSGSLFGYDSMGRVTTTWQCGPDTCGTGNQGSHWLAYSYDWTGNLTMEADGPSGEISYGRSPAGEVTAITNNSYSLNGSSGTANLVSNVQNGPFGPTSWQLGNGLSGVWQYDSMGRMTGGWVCSGSSQADCTGGSQLYGFAVGWRGSYVWWDCDTVINQCNNDDYDQFGRLASKTFTQGGSPTNYTYTYDRWGNRWEQNAANGGPSPQLTFNTTTNEISTSGYTYDAAGNMTSDSIHTYTYDAEGNVIAVDGGNTAQYVYDALNRRIRAQTSGSTYESEYDYAGRHISNWIEPGDIGNFGKIYWDGAPVAYRAQNAQTFFEHPNWLGSSRLRTNYQGSVAETTTSLPFGDGTSTTVDESYANQDDTHFGMLDLDNETDTDHAQFRQYSPMAGRWMSPDPYSGSYDFTNPQSLNRYTYVENQPLSAMDPEGLAEPGGGGGGSDCNMNPGGCPAGYSGGGNGGGSGGYDWGWDGGASGGVLEAADAEEFAAWASDGYVFGPWIVVPGLDPAGIQVTLSTGQSTYDPLAGVSASYIYFGGYGPTFGVVTYPSMIAGGPGGAPNNGGTHPTQPNSNPPANNVICTSEGCVIENAPPPSKQDLCHGAAILGLTGLLAVPGADIPDAAAWTLYGIGGASAVAGVSICW